MIKPLRSAVLREEQESEISYLCDYPMMTFPPKKRINTELLIDGKPASL